MEAHAKLERLQTAAGGNPVLADALVVLEGDRKRQRTEPPLPEPPCRGCLGCQTGRLA